MRVTIAVENLGDHGANRVTVDRATRWRAAGDDVTLLCLLHEDPTQALPVPGELPVAWATTPQQRFRTALPLAFLALLRAARASDVVVSGTETGLGTVLGWLAARLTRTPFAVTVQSDLLPALRSYVPPRLRTLNRHAVLASDLAVCVSPALGDSMRGLGMSDHRVAVVINGVPADRIRAAARPRPRPTPPVASSDTRPVLLAMGRLELQKGFDLLLRAHRLALDAGAPPHRVVVLGEGAQHEALQALTRELDLSDSVEFVGFCPDPFPTLARSAAFVLPSRWEGLPLCLAEALACGTPCIAFDCATGPADVLARGRFGRLVPSGDVVALGAALRDHLLDQDPLRRAAQDAATAELEIFDPALAAERHRRALHALVVGGRRRPVRTVMYRYTKSSFRRPSR